MKSAFSDTDIRGHPHITSKIHVWKKNYSSLSSMLAKSGIGWNHTENMLDATNEAWEAQLKVDDSVHVMRYKRWPYYEDWCEIFGNDKATGSRAESFVAAVHGVLNLTEQVRNDVEVEMEDIYRLVEGDGESMSVKHTSPSTPSVGSKVKSKKRKKISEGDDKIVVAINNLADITKESMTNLIKEMAAEKKLAESQMTTAMDSVLETLQTITELTSDEKVCVAEVLVDNPNKISLFLKLDHDGRLSLSKRLLNP
ncbi:uncharacterized protein LOC142527610 [Primulina tabacum]|uniref:uncharacterized protein LOC142527610 n=1 Tax=Primulina tabacum TaxID=48773 RepID=UPI003F5A1B84